MNISEKAKEFAIKCHTETNHLYDGKPYHEAHLQPVVDMGEKYIYLIPIDDRPTVRGGLWLHDGIEDCRITWNDVKNHLNEDIANLAYALTNEKGKTRKERANAKYYKGIRQTKYATFCKLCDRLANVHFSYQSKQSGKSDSMFHKYGKENNEFMWELLKPEWYQIMQHFIRLATSKKDFLMYRLSQNKYSEMFIYLQSLVNQK